MLLVARQPLPAPPDQVMPSALKPSDAGASGRPFGPSMSRPLIQTYWAPFDISTTEPSGLPETKLAEGVMLTLPSAPGAQLTIIGFPAWPDLVMKRLST